MFAVVTFAIVQALETDAGSRVAVAEGVRVDVAIAVARSTLAARHSGVAVVVLGATVATFAGVARKTVADGRLCHGVECASVRVRDQRARSSRAWTRPTRNVDAGERISIEAALSNEPIEKLLIWKPTFLSLDSHLAHFAVGAGRVVATADTRASLRIASVRVTVAVTADALRIVPEARLTFVALQKGQMQKGQKLHLLAELVANSPDDRTCWADTGTGHWRRRRTDRRHRCCDNRKACSPRVRTRSSRAHSGRIGGRSRLACTDIGHRACRKCPTTTRSGRNRTSGRRCT